MTVLDPADALAQAHIERARGHYLNQLAAGREAVVRGLDPPDPGWLEVVAAAVQLARWDDAAAARAQMSRERDRWSWAKAEMWLAYGDILTNQQDHATRRLSDVDHTVHHVDAPPHLDFFWTACRARLEQAADRSVEALQLADTLLAKARMLGPSELQLAHYHAGYLWLDLGVHERAIEAFDAALAIADQSPASRAAAHLGACLGHRGLWQADLAEHHAREAVALYAAGDFTHREGEARLTLAETLHALGRSPEAASLAWQSVACFERSQSVASEMQARLCLAQILASLGGAPAAQEQLRRVLAESAASAHHAEASVLMAEYDGRVTEDLWGALADAPQRERSAMQARASRLGVLDAGRKADMTLLNRWLSRYGDACRLLGETASQRVYRALEVRDHVAAREEEQARAEALTDALKTQQCLREAAESAERERRDLLELVAHDLRNPLSALMLLLDGLSEVDDLDELVELVGVGERTARSMLWVLNEALCTSEALGRAQDLTPLAFDDLVADSVQGFQSAARAKHQQLTITVSGGCGVRGVRSQVQSMVDNLVSNALKFTPSGGAVHVSVAIVDGDVRVEVLDTGPGLAPGDAERVFERRQRGQARPTEGEPTTGLGLYLVRRMVQAHGGAVGAANRADGGSVFWLTLPHHAESPAP